jgi:uncharacterized protein (DUF952 family)
MTEQARMEILFHLARRRDWEAAQRVGAYRVSTLNLTLKQQGFIHLSFARQARWVADRFYAGARRTAGAAVDRPVEADRAGRD